MTVRFLPSGTAFGFPGALARLRDDPRRALGAVRFVGAARSALRAEGPFDRIVAHFLVPSAFPIALGTFAPLEIVVHGSDARLVARLPGPVRRWIVRSLLARGAAFRFVSEDLRQRLARATTPDLLAASSVEPAALDVSAAPSRDAARDELSIAPATRLAVIVARLVPEKNVARAIALAERAADRVVVVGDGPLAARLRRAFPRATFVGQLGRRGALAWIAAADVLVSASRDEGAPTVIREARALGTAVVAVPCGDLRAWAARDPGIVLAEP